MVTNHKSIYHSNGTVDPGMTIHARDCRLVLQALSQGKKMHGHTVKPCWKRDNRYLTQNWWCVTAKVASLGLRVVPATCRQRGR